MVTLHVYSLRSRGEATSEPSDRDRQRRHRARMSVHQTRAQRHTNTERMRAARARQTQGERAAQRCDNADAMRAARARQTQDERTARRRDNTDARRAARARQTQEERAARREARRRREEASRPEWAHLRVHNRPSPPAIRLGPTHLCSHCGARLLYEEKESWCCNKGKIVVAPLPPLPEGWEEMFRRPAFRIHSRKYNNLFAFTAMGVTGDEGFVHQPTPSCVKIHGRTYHRVLPAQMRGPVQWYVHDPDQRRDEATTLSLDQQLVTAIQETLTDINPYARNLRQLGQEPAEDVSLHVEWKEQSREIAAIIHRGDSEVTGGNRTVVFWRRTELAPTFISPLHPLYEPLQYPLFFPHGTRRWFVNMRSVHPSSCKMHAGNFPIATSIMHMYTGLPYEVKRAKPRTQ